MSKLELDTEGACACGAVRISVKGRVLTMLLCACRDCRKASGTGHSAVAGFSRASVSIAGEVRGFARTANSGSEITRHFCPECGTPVFAVTARAPDLVLLPVGLFDDPDWFAPNQAIFTRSHLQWDALPEGIPRYDTYRSEGGF